MMINPINLSYIDDSFPCICSKTFYFYSFTRLGP